MINYKKLLFPTFSFLMILSSQVYAGLYVTGQAGAYGMSHTNNISDNLFDSDAIRATGRIGAGYLWDVNSCFKLGLEAGFQGYQTEHIDNYKYQRNSLDFLAVADFTLNNKADFFVKAGPAYVIQKHEVNFSDYYNYYSYSISDNVTVPQGVIGIGYNVNDAINLNLSLNHEFKKTNNFDHFSPSTTSVMAGFTLRYS